MGDVYERFYDDARRTNRLLGKKLGKAFPDKPHCIAPLDTTIALLAADLHR